MGPDAMIFVFWMLRPDAMIFVFWIWVNSVSWWWAGRPDMLHSMRSQGVEHDWATELNWTEVPRISIKIYVQSCFSHAWLSVTLWTIGLQPTRLLCPWVSPGKNTELDCHTFLQGIFSTQGSNPCLFTSPALVVRFFTTSATWEAPLKFIDLPKW